MVPQGQRFCDGVEGSGEERAVFGSEPSISDPAAGKNELLKLSLLVRVAASMLARLTVAFL